MERIDDLQRNGLKIIQDSELFCFGTDAVLLADFVQVLKGARVVDLGTASGILPLLLYGRQPDASYQGIEIQPALCSLALRNVQMNGLENRIQVIQGDLKDAPMHFGNINDVVVANPPYEKVEDGAARGTESHMIARKEVKTDLAGVCTAAAALLKNGGKFYMIHKASRLAEIMCTLKACRLEPKRLRLVQANKNAEPRYVLVQAVKGGGEHLRILPTLVLYEADGQPGTEMKRIYGNE